MLAAYISQ